MLVRQIILKDEADIDPNDQTSILEHLDKVVRCFFPTMSKNIQTLNFCFIFSLLLKMIFLVKNATFFVTTVFF